MKNGIRRLTAVLLTAALCMACICGVFAETAAAQATKYAGMTAEEIVAGMTLQEKAAQMLQPACYYMDDVQMQANCYGSLVSKPDCLTAKEWREYIGWLQEAAMASETGIPFIFGQDNVHGVGYCMGTVIFPHNIGLGAANDEELMYQAGLITGDESKQCHMLWNLAPVVAQSGDPRWGRTYESYGADIDTITRLSTAYTRGLLDSGMIVCAKHFFGDGNTAFGSSGEEISGVPGLLDRGDARISDEQIRALIRESGLAVNCDLKEYGALLPTLALAEKHLMELKTRRGQVGELCALLGIRNRTLAPTEEKYLQNWLEMGFGKDPILLAYDKTVAKKGELAWPYMNRILENWHAKGLHTLPEIEAGDAPPKVGSPSGKRGGQVSAGPTSEDYERMQRLLRKMDGGGDHGT